jgi:2-polyprenyl-3-methyl-5-hydroxy-6-metoxy-1,4-benzoquinol methylase
MPDARWYEAMYRGRDLRTMPLEPGHKYFLTDKLAPRPGKLLDVGCGTGNFLAAARAVGYDVAGTELDRNAAHFATQRLGMSRVLSLALSEFGRRYPHEAFDVVTFFEVLEHQTEPIKFLRSVKACLRFGGVIALSVPNRNRWSTAPDVLDYPPNHFLRWSVAALRAFLTTNGFEILSMCEQPADLAHTAQVLNMKLRMGVTKRVVGETAGSFRELLQMEPEAIERAVQGMPSERQRLLNWLRRGKLAACFLIALIILPYVRARGHKGAYLYCLARYRE